MAWKAGALLWGAAEAFLFFVVPDVIISYVALRRGFRAGVIACLLAATGAALGGATMYAWSERSPDAMAAVRAVPAVSDAMVADAKADMREEGWFVAALKGPLTSTPYKVYAALAPSEGASLPAFAAAAFPVRLPRFLVVAGVFALIGAAVRGRVSGKVTLTAFTLGWVLFYGWFWTVHLG